jgi:hypothetical protein
MASKKKSKWIISLAALAVILLVMFLLGCKSVHTEIFIPASPEKVWGVLMDASGYKAWNPVLVPLEGEIKEGQKIKYRWTQPDGTQSEISATVIRLIPPKELNQYGGTPGILTFDHKWLLEPVKDGTRVTQQEEYRGIGVLFWDAGQMEPAYQKVNASLKNRVMQTDK